MGKRPCLHAPSRRRLCPRLIAEHAIIERYQRKLLSSWSVGIEPSTTCSFGQGLSGCATNRCRNDVVVTASLRVFMLREFDDDCTNFQEAAVWLGVSWSAWGDPDTFAAAFEKPTTSVSRCLRQSHCFAEHLLAGHCLEGCLVSQTSMSDRRGNRSDRLAHPDCARRRTTTASFG